MEVVGIFYGHLVYFMVIWYIFPCFGMLYKEKSGNPGTERRPKFEFIYHWVKKVESKMNNPCDSFQPNCNLTNCRQMNRKKSTNMDLFLAFIKRFHNFFLLKR
jgi:hypothetical protein